MALGLGLAVVSSATDVDAQSKKGTKAAPAPAAPTEAPTTKKPIVLTPSGMVWGMGTKDVAKVVDKLIDELYRDEYKKTTSSVKLKALDAQIAEEKSIFRRSRIDFGALPTGVDATVLKGEYSYLNKEALMTLTRGDAKVHFFFIQDRLWKIIDEKELGEKSPYGAKFDTAADKLKTKYGVGGRVLAADFDKGRNATEVDWKDSSTHLRLIQRSDTAIALAYEDLSTLGSLASLRANKPPEENAIDPGVADVTRKDEAPPAPPPSKATDKKKK